MGIDDLKRAREEFFKSTMGQRTRSAWGKNQPVEQGQIYMTDKQRMYLSALFDRVERMVQYGNLKPESMLNLLKDYNKEITLREASNLISRCKFLLGEN